MKWNISNPKFESDALNKIYRLNTSPWAGHRNFAYDLIKFIKPRNVLELGTHFGCSFFAFAQSIKDHELNTTLTAIDSWEGDEHAGQYGEEVLEVLNLTIEKAYSNLNIRLIRDRFDKGLINIPDGSMDIIHIDGLHTYEAVSKDFKDALPKLATDGIMLFHDPYPEIKYTSAKFWKEIKKKYPHFEFTHSWGLGVLFPKGDKWYKSLLEENFIDKVKYYEYKALFERSNFQVIDLTQFVQERDKTIDAQKLLIDEKDRGIKAQMKLIDERGDAIEAQSRMIDDRNKVIESQTKLVDDKDLAIKAQTKLIDERDQYIKELQELLRNKTDNYDKLEKEMSKLNANLGELSKELSNLNSKKIIKILKKLKAV